MSVGSVLNVLSLDGMSETPKLHRIPRSFLQFQDQFEREKYIICSVLK